MGHMPDTRHNIESLLFESRSLVGIAIQASVGTMAVQAETPTQWASLVRVCNVVMMDADPPPLHNLAVAKGIPLAQHVHAPKAYA